MTDIIDEIEASHQEAKTNLILNKLIKTIGIVALIAIIITIAVNWYIERKKDKIYEIASQMNNILRKINTPGANNKDLIRDLENLDNSDNSYGALSNFYLAAVNKTYGNLSKMAYFYDKVVANEEYNDIIRQYAAINSINVKLQNKSLTGEQAIKAINKILAENKNIPFALAITMLKASILIEEKQFSEAANELKLIITSSPNSFNDSINKIGNTIYSYVQGQINLNEVSKNK